MKISAVKRGFALLLSTLLTAGALLPGVSVKAAEGEDGKSQSAGNQVIWSKTIKAPEIPKDYTGEGPLALPLDPEGGWYDLELPKDGRSDGAAAAANMLHWWFHLNGEVLETYLKKTPVVDPDYQGKVADPQKVRDFLAEPGSQKLEDSPVYQLFDQKAGEKSYAPDSYVDFFLNGYSLHTKQNKPENFDPKDPESGYLFPVFDMSNMTQRLQDLGTYQELGEELQIWLEDDSAVVLGLRGEKDKVHYVNLWGAEYDSENRLAAVYVTDSADGSGGEKAMVRMAVSPAEETKVQLTALDSPKDPGFAWENMYTLSSGQDMIKEYEVPVEPQWQEPEYEWAADRKACTAIREQANGDGKDFDESIKVESKQTKAPTDKKPGEITHVATFSADWAKPQTLSEPIPAAETAWGQVQYQWSSDYKTCTAYRVSKDDESIRQSTDAISATSTTGDDGKITYVADFAAKNEKWDWAGSDSRTVDPPKQEPTAGETTYKWSEDLANCTASVTYSDGTTKSAQATVSSETTKKAGCETKGEVTYTASFTEDWAKTQTKVKETKALGHDWGEPTYKWNDQECRAVRTCKRDESHTETAVPKNVAAKTTKEPTEKEKGETTYTATFTEDWAKTQTITVANIPVISDNWGKVTYTWSNDNRKCTAKRVNLDDSSKEQVAYAKVSFRRTKEPTEKEKGETTYEARFKELWAKDQVKTVADIPSIRDDSKNDALWNAPTYEWSEDNTRCTASRTKKSDPSTVDMAKGNVTEKVIKKATCQEPGESEFTATFRESWAKDQKKTAQIKAGEHDLEQVPEVPATGGTVGMKAHYRCKVCGKLFLDPEGTQEVTRKDLEVTAPAMAGDNVLLDAIPEKEGTAAIVPDALQKALQEHRDAKGVQVNAGDATVVFTRSTAESILKDAKNARKLVLQVRLTNFSDSEMTSKQAMAAQKNVNGSIYYVALSDGRKLIEAPCTVMVPYQPVGGGQTMVYAMEEKGSFSPTTCQYSNGYLAWNADTGFFMASEFDPVAAKGKSNVGLIIGIVVLVLSFLGFMAIGGYFLYKKFSDVDEDDFSDGPQLDQAARERIRSGSSPVRPAQPGPAGYRPPAAPYQPQNAAPRTPVNPVNPAQPQAPAAPQAPVNPAPVPPQAPIDPAPVPTAPAQPQIPPEMAGGYQGAFERNKPSYADKAVQAAHHSQKPAAPQDPDPAGEEELEELKHWLDEIE